MKWLVRFIHAFDKKQRAYVSPMDQLLQKFDSEHPEKSASQQKEIKKHADVFHRQAPSRINWK